MKIVKYDGRSYEVPDCDLVREPTNMLEVIREIQMRDARHGRAEQAKQEEEKLKNKQTPWWRCF